VLDGAFYLPEIRDGGPYPAPMAIGFHFVDEVVHAWDLAKSIGATAEFDDEVLDMALSIAARVPNDPVTRGDGFAFALGADPDPDAPTLDRIVTLLGRRPPGLHRERRCQRPSLICGKLGRQDDLGHPGQCARHRAHPLGLVRVRLELLLIDAGDASLRIQVYPRQRGGAVDVAQLDARVRAQRLRRVPRSAEDVRQGHREAAGVCCRDQLLRICSFPLAEP